MKVLPLSRSAAGFGYVAFGLAAMTVSPNLVTGAAAQITTTVTSSQHFSYADNQGVVDVRTNETSPATTERADFYLGSQDTNANGQAGLPSTTFQTYCVNAFSQLQSSQNVAVESISGNLSSGQGSSGVNVGGAIAWLYNNNVGLITDYSETSAQMSAALQLSIWEVEYNWTGSLLGGIDPTLLSGNLIYEGVPTTFPPDGINYNPVTTGAIRSDAEQMLDNWNGQVANGTLLASPSSGPNHGQSLVAPFIAASSAPEPSALVLFLGPILGLASRQVFRRRL